MNVGLNKKVMAQTVIGIFDTSAEAYTAVERLVSSGFLRDRVDLSLHSDSSQYVSGRSVDDDNDDGLGEKISRFFKSLFDSDDDRDKYATVAKKGAAVVTVTAETHEEAERASDLLDECGAVDVDERSKAYANGLWSGTSTERKEISSTSSDGSYTSAEAEITNRDNLRDDDFDKTRSIPIIEEELQVGKREVERGGVRIRSRIVERPVEETVRLREERVTVDRNAVNRPASAGDFDTFREGEMEIKQRAEVPVVNKEARVVEEINLNKDVREREETIRDTVRKTEVEIDNEVTDIDDEESLSDRRQKRDTDL
jgi:stress response protein YsnF